MTGADAGWGVGRKSIGGFFGFCGTFWNGCDSGFGFGGITIGGGGTRGFSGAGGCGAGVGIVVIGFSGVGAACWIFGRVLTGAVTVAGAGRGVCRGTGVEGGMAGTGFAAGSSGVERRERRSMAFFIWGTGWPGPCSRMRGAGMAFWPACTGWGIVGDGLGTGWGRDCGLVGIGVGVGAGA